MSIYAGTFVTDATAVDDQVYVSLPDFDDGLHDHGPVRWQPLHDGTLPADGDPCVVFESDDGDYWVLSWSTGQASGWPVLRVSHGHPTGDEPPGFYVDVDSTDYMVYEVT